MRKKELEEIVQTLREKTIAVALIFEFGHKCI